jgi:hypothetical protein
MKQIQKFLRDLPGDMHDEFVKQTPIRTGNAKRSTDLKRGEIQGNYAYANRLNKGWSTQAPEGMTDPTIDFARVKLRGLK